MRQFKPGQLQTGSLYNISSSYALTASFATNLNPNATASYAINAETASYVNPLRQNVQITGSLYFPDNTHSIYFSGSGAASRLTWNDTDGTLELGLKGGIVQTEIGQGLVTRVINKTTPNIDLSASNYQVVVVSGAQGQRLAVKLAQADNDANSAGTLGIIAEDIAKNQEGFIITVGLLKNRNTTGALQGETWSDGDILYLSPITPGAITNIKPQAPQHTVIVGYVEYAHANNGKIYVKIDNGYELDELHNVRITTSSLSSGDLLVYSGSVWANTKQLTGSYGLTGSLAATTITASNAQITGNVQILGTASISVLNVTYESASIIYSSGSNQFGDAANDTQTLWGTVDVKTGPLLVTGSVRATGGFTGSFSGSVAAPGLNTQIVFNNNGTLSAISDFVYSSSVIGIGTSSPASNYKTNIVGSVGITPISSNNLIIGTSAQTSSFPEGTAILIDNRNLTIGSWDNSIFPVGTKYNHTNNTPGLDSIEFIAGATTGANGRVMFISASGNVGIGTTTPISKLDVAGTTRISGSFNTAASGSILTVIGSGSAQPIFTVQGSQGELFSITDSLSGSLFSVNDISGLPILEVFSDNTTLIGNYQDPMLITTAKVVQTNSGSFTVYSLPTASYDTAFFEYSIKSGSNARAGTIMAIQLGSTVNFTETTTTDFGNTTAVSFTVIVTGSNMALTGSSTTGSWTTKCIVRGI